MGSVLFRPDMEAVEWILLLAVGASGLCISALVMMLLVSRWRMYRNRKGSRKAAGQVIF